MLNMIKDAIKKQTALQESADLIIGDTLPRGAFDESIVLSDEFNDFDYDALTEAEDEPEIDTSDVETKDTDENIENAEEPTSDVEDKDDDIMDQSIDDGEDATRDPEPIDTNVDGNTGDDILDQPIDGGNDALPTTDDTSDNEPEDDILSMEIDMGSNTPKDILPVPPASAGDAVTDADDSIMNQHIDSGFGGEDTSVEDTPIENTEESSDIDFMDESLDDTTEITDEEINEYVEMYENLIESGFFDDDDDVIMESADEVKSAFITNLRQETKKRRSSGIKEINANNEFIKSYRSRNNKTTFVKMINSIGNLITKAPDKQAAMDIIMLMQFPQNINAMNMWNNGVPLEDIGGNRKSAKNPITASDVKSMMNRLEPAYNAAKKVVTLWNKSELKSKLIHDKIMSEKIDYKSLWSTFDSIEEGLKEANRLSNEKIDRAERESLNSSEVKKLNEAASAALRELQKVAASSGMDVHGTVYSFFGAKSFMKGLPTIGRNLKVSQVYSPNDIIDMYQSLKKQHAILSRKKGPLSESSDIDFMDDDKFEAFQKFIDEMRNELFTEEITLGGGDDPEPAKDDTTSDDAKLPSEAETALPDDNTDGTSTDTSSEEESPVTAAVKDKVAESDSADAITTAATGSSQQEIMNKLSNITKNLEDVKKSIMQSIQ